MAHLARAKINFWGPQQGRRVILWESLRPEDQERCLTELRSDRSWVIWCKAKPKDMPAQSFREYGKCIFVGKCKKQKQADESQAESAGGRHVTRARGWWKRGDVAACAAQTNMHCWVHQDALFNDDQAETHMREAWEHEGSKDELNIVLQGLEQHFWRGTEAGRMWCYEFPGETWAGDGLANKGSCRAFSAWVSALSLRGSPRCALTLTKKVRAPLSTLSLMHSMIDVMMSTFASPASVVRGPLPIHRDTLLRAASLSHKYSRSTSNAVACKVRAIAASSGLRELTPSSSLPHELLDYAQVIESGRSLFP